MVIRRAAHGGSPDGGGRRTGRPCPTRRRPRWSAESGHALLLTLFSLMMLGVATMLLTSLVGTELRQRLRDRSQLELRAMNDAVLAETLAGLADSNGFGGVTARAWQAGTISSTVVRVSPTRRRVVAVSELGGRRRSVHATVILTATGPRVVEWSPPTEAGKPDD